MNLRLFLMAFGFLGLLNFSSVAQEKEESSKFKKDLDSIIEDAFHRFDEKLGTYIFRDEPENFDEFEEQNDEVDSSTNDNENIRKPEKRSFPRGLYSVPPEHGIVRNISPAMPWEIIDENLLFRYNRVEGLFLGLNFPQKYYWDDHHMSLFASGGYGFKSHKWRGGIGAAQQFGTNETLFEIGVEGHTLTDTHDEWLLDLDENNLAAFLLRYDYRDYYERRGASAWTGIYKRWQKSDLQFQISYRNDSYKSLENTTNWSIFGTDRIFRENLPINDGRMHSLLATLHFHSTESRKLLTGGWSFSGSAELAGNAFGGDFDFNSYTIDLRRYQPISKYNNLNIRLRGSSATGDLPLQKQFSLGGLSTLPAYRFKEFNGNRMLLLNAEYVVNGKMFDDVDFFPSWLLRNINMIIFADAGYVNDADRNANLTDGFKSLDKTTIRSDWGVGIGTRDAKLRLGFAWRTDVAQPPMVFLRINRPF
ncbi:MAG: BamA/TamA family outer membrane protein [Ignavibacteriales bacterium]|nr:BamA/TamA family outer membrane protein [Ignavibacteriales bacterium]